MSAKQLKITLVKSPIGSNPNHKKNLFGLGLRRMHQTVLREDTPSIRGVLHKIKHLLRWEEVL